VGEFLVGVLLGLGALAVAAIGAFFVLRRWFERASHKVADDIGRVLAELSGRAVATPAGRRAASATRAAAGRFTHLGAYAAAEGMSEEDARREFARTVERIAHIMDSAFRLPIIGPIGLDAALGLFPVAGDTISAAISVTLIARSLKYGIPGDVIARLLANVLVDLLVGAVPVVGDLADIWFRANERNIAILREYLGQEAGDVIDVTPSSVSDVRV
jgi:hypothetical protein